VVGVGVGVGSVCAAAASAAGRVAARFNTRLHGKDGSRSLGGA
jgi:hypothetical protein